MAERIADYCDAVLNVETLCKSGYRCCVSRDAFGDSPPPELLVIDRTKLNGTRPDEKYASTTRMPEKIGLTTRPPAAIRPITLSSLLTTPATGVSTPLPERPKPVLGENCKGECVNGLFAFLCDNIDTDADCPGDGFCCITEAPAKPVKKIFSTIIIIIIQSTLDNGTRYFPKINKILYIYLFTSPL